METNIPSPGKRMQEWEDGEKLWALDEQQLSQAKPQLGFLLQNQRNRDLYSGITEPPFQVSFGEELGIMRSAEGRLREAKQRWGKQPP